MFPNFFSPTRNNSNNNDGISNNEQLQQMIQDLQRERGEMCQERAALQRERGQVRQEIAALQRERARINRTKYSNNRHRTHSEIDEEDDGNNNGRTVRRRISYENHQGNDDGQQGVNNRNDRNGQDENPGRHRSIVAINITDNNDDQDNINDAENDHDNDESAAEGADEGNNDGQEINNNNRNYNDYDQAHDWTDADKAHLGHRLAANSRKAPWNDVNNSILFINGLITHGKNWRAIYGDMDRGGLIRNKDQINDKYKNHLVGHKKGEIFHEERIPDETAIRIGLQPGALGMLKIFVYFVDNATGQQYKKYIQDPEYAFNRHQQAEQENR